MGGPRICDLPRRFGEVTIAVWDFLVARLHPDLNFRQSGDANLSVSSDRNGFVRSHATRNRQRCREGLQGAVDVIIAVGVGVVGVIQVREHDVGEDQEPASLGMQEAGLERPASLEVGNVPHRPYGCGTVS